MNRGQLHRPITSLHLNPTRTPHDNEQGPLLFSIHADDVFNSTTTLPCDKGRDVREITSDRCLCILFYLGNLLNLPKLVWPVIWGPIRDMWMVQWQWPKDSNIFIVGVRDLSACQRKSYPGRIEVTLNFILYFIRYKLCITLCGRLGFLLMMVQVVEMFSKSPVIRSPFYL